MVKQAGDSFVADETKNWSIKKFAAAVDAWRTGKTQEKAKSPTRDIAKQLYKQMGRLVFVALKFNKEKHALAQEVRKQKTNWLCVKQRLWKKLQLRNLRWHRSHLSQRQTITKYGTSKRIEY